MEWDIYGSDWKIYSRLPQLKKKPNCRAFTSCFLKLQFQGDPTQEHEIQEVGNQNTAKIPILQRILSNCCQNDGFYHRIYFIQDTRKQFLTYLRTSKAMLIIKIIKQTSYFFM